MSTGVVLLHGGATTGAHWDLVGPALRSPFVAPDVPGRGGRPADVATLSLDIGCDSVAADARSLGTDRLVLVAHSSGGLLLPGLVERLGDAVAAVVLVAASVTSDGGCGLEAMKPAHAEGLRLQWAQPGPWLTPPDPPSPDRLRRSWGGDLAEDQLAFATAPVRWVSDTTTVYREPLDWSRVRALPGAYVVTVADRAVPFDLQLRMAGLLPLLQRIPLPTGHLAAVTMPTTLADLVEGVVSWVEITDGRS